VAALLAACCAVVASQRIVFPSRNEHTYFKTRKTVRHVPSDDYEASDYADKIIFLNKHLPNALEQISAQNLQRFSIQVLFLIFILHNNMPRCSLNILFCKNIEIKYQSLSGRVSYF
jgi:hypothetical protein